MRESHRIPSICLAVFATVAVALGISPASRATWLLENLPTFVAVPVLLFTYRRFRFSDRAYLQGTIFVLLHTVGSHYTYSLVPVGDWVREAFDLSRNHYDRLVHFAAGWLLLLPSREVAFRRRAELGTLRELALSWTMIAAWAALYEIVEWMTAIVVDPAAGTAFLGTQGDPWEAQKDMTLASLGAIVAAGIELSIQRHRAGAGAASAE
jgi:putative membrane protein